MPELPKQARMNALVTFKDVNFSYGGHKVLDDVNISILAGENGTN